jgi:G3E family GTPase
VTGRIPVHIVSGAPGSGKTALIARLCAERGDWLGFVNALPTPAPANVIRFSAGCPCCTGKVVLQVSLARALRETRATRALVELADPQHAQTLEKLLGELPFSLSVAGARPVLLPGDAGVGAADLDG